MIKSFFKKIFKKNRKSTKKKEIISAVAPAIMTKRCSCGSPRKSA